MPDTKQISVNDDSQGLPSSSGIASWRRWAMVMLLNLWLVFHCVGIVLPPFSVPPAPTLVQDAYEAIQFYPQIMFLDHGYHFFGPDPGDSTLLQYIAKTEHKTIRGTIPNKQIFPRLLYHRHFMLTEAIPRIESFDREIHAMQNQTYAARIRRQCQAQSVDLYRVTHRLTPVQRFLAGASLDDPNTYDKDNLGRFSWAPSIASSAQP